MTNPFPSNAHHILSFVQSLNGGGVERALLRLAAGWIEHGRRVTLLIGDDSGPLAAELPIGVDLFPIGGGRYRDLLRAAGSVRTIRPDLIFCPGNHYTGVALATRPFARAPIVAKLSNALVHTHRGTVAWGYRRWLKLHPRFIDHLVAMTPAMAVEARTAMGFPTERISVIANPPARTIADAASVALPAGRFILGVGRLAPQKRWDRLIAAMPRLADPDISLVIFGEGQMRSALQAQIDGLGLTHRVRLSGHAADPLPAMARATVVALTSDHEGVPGVIREALAEGTPVISTDSSVAIPELITTAAQGTIVPRNDEAALVAALNHWLAPGKARPVPVRATGDPVIDYLALFDRLSATSRGGVGMR